MERESSVEAKASSFGKYRLFGAAGALAGFAASALYLIWEAGISGDPPNWGPSAMRVNSSYVVGVGLLVAFVVLLLTLAQSRYLGRRFELGVAVQKTGVAAFCGIVAGFLAPYLSYGVIGAPDDVGRFLGWILSGAFTGLIVSQAVINMDPKWGMFGGAAGGLVGCAILYGAHQNLLLGFTAMGAAIGCMLAYCEASGRSHWLAVELKPDGEAPRTFEVTLGAAPVRVGYDKASDIRVDAIINAPSQSFAVFELADGKVVYSDLLRNERRYLKSEEKITLSNAIVSIHSK